jgi:hypothetical protein
MHRSGAGNIAKIKADTDRNIIEFIKMSSTAAIIAERDGLKILPRPMP